MIGMAADGGVGDGAGMAGADAAITVGKGRPTEDDGTILTGLICLVIS